MIWRHYSDIERISVRVADALSLPVGTLYSRSRDSRVMTARQMAMYLARGEGYTTTQVGLHFERHHTVVIHACRKIAKWIQENPDLAVITLDEVAA